MTARPSVIASPARAVVVALVALVACVAGLVTSCGPSALSVAYDAFRGAVEPHLEAEVAVWNQLADLAADQDDERGAARYRAHLHEKALPYYSGLEKDFAALATGHERLVPAKDALVAYAQCRREFVELEIRRIDLASKAESLAAIQRADEAVTAMRSKYVEEVGDDVPDVRFADVNALVQDFLKFPYKKAVDGAMSPEEAVGILRRDFLVKMHGIRNDRYDDDPRSRAFRKFVVASDEFLTLLAEGLPTVVDVLRAKSRVEVVQADAERHRKAYQQVFRDVQRDR